MIKLFIVCSVFSKIQFILPVQNSHKPDSDESFIKVCLFCGEENNSLKYTCNCRGEDWQREYRTLDIKIKVDEEAEEAIKRSFQNFDLSDKKNGILQYLNLPWREYRDENMPVVGLTPLTFLDKFSIKFNFNLFVKNEGNNPSGCFKDRETLMCVLNTKRRGLKNAVIYSSGNAAASAALFARKTDINLITFVAGDTYKEKINYIRNHGSHVVVIGDEHTNFETGFRMFARLNAEGVFADAYYDNWSVRNPYRVQGDKTMALEIVKQLSKGKSHNIVPEYVIVPTANGSCLSGLWKGFKELNHLGLLEKLPKMVSAGIKYGNPVYKAVKDGIFNKPVKCDIGRADIEDTEIGSIILAEEGYDSIEAARAVNESDGIALEVSGEEVKNIMQELYSLEEILVKENSILPEPAALVSLAAVQKLKDYISIGKDENIVAIITGHGRKAEEKIKDLMEDEPEVIETVDEIMEDKKESFSFRKHSTPGKCYYVKAEFEEVKNVFQNINLEN